MPLVGTTWWSAPEAFEDENRDKIKISRCVYSLIFFEVLTGKVPFKDIPLRDILQSICDRVRLGFTRCGLLSW
jgi:serine/threonine protein kinase